MTSPRTIERLPADEIKAVTELARDIFDTLAGRAAGELLSALGSAGLLSIGVEEESGVSGGHVYLAGLVAQEAGAHLASLAVLHQMVGILALSSAGSSPADVAPFSDGRASLAVAFTTNTDRASTPVAGHPDTLLIGTPRGLYRTDDVPEGDGSDSWCSPDWIETPIDLHAIQLHRIGELPRARMDLASGLTAAYILGAADRVLHRCVEYAGQRHQFGAPIGSFQAVKHSLADAWIRLHHARSLTLDAFLDPEDPVALSIAVLAAGSAAHDCAERCLQAMGGIGFTWESDVHRFLKTITRCRNWPINDLDRRQTLIDAELGDAHFSGVDNSRQTIAGT
jgi:alkylation response protein AidB-like acyl-CoA dehydrogenase